MTTFTSYHCYGVRISNSNQIIMPKVVQPPATNIAPHSSHGQANPCSARNHSASSQVAQSGDRPDSSPLCACCCRAWPAAVYLTYLIVSFSRFRTVRRNRPLTWGRLFINHLICSDRTDSSSSSRMMHHHHIVKHPHTECLMMVLIRHQQQPQTAIVIHSKIPSTTSFCTNWSTNCPVASSMAIWPICSQWRQQQHHHQQQRQKRQHALCQLHHPPTTG